MRIGIIGRGRFGRLWTRSMRGLGHQVRVYDPRKRTVRIEDDFLFVLVPISEFESCCRMVAPMLAPRTVVVDACSVKVHPVRVMRAIFGKQRPLIATHPLFGPDSARQSGLTGKRIVVIPVRVSLAEQRRFEGILRSLRLEIIHTSAKRHDEEVARSQALVHFIGRGLERLALPRQRVATPDYESLRRMCDLVRHDTRRLFEDMQRYNPHTDRVRQSFVQAMQSINAYLEREPSTIAGLRAKIDRIDTSLMTLLADRLRVARLIGKQKRATGEAVNVPKREREMRARRKKLAARFELKAQWVERVFRLILEESKTMQRNI